MTPEPLKVLVTGASGLLGAGVAGRLVEAGHDVVTLQRRPSGVTGARDVQGSVTSAETVRQAMAGRDTLVHVAAKVSVSGPAEQYEQAIALMPNSPEPHYNLGLLYVDLGDLTKAAEQADRAYALGYPLDGLKRKLAAARRP